MEKKRKKELRVTRSLSAYKLYIDRNIRDIADRFIGKENVNRTDLDLCGVRNSGNIETVEILFRPDAVNVGPPGRQRTVEHDIRKKPVIYHRTPLSISALGKIDGFTKKPNKHNWGRRTLAPGLSLTSVRSELLRMLKPTGSAGSLLPFVFLRKHPRA